MRLTDAGVAALLAVTLGCGGGSVQVAAPSPALSTPKVIAVVMRDGVLLRAERLDGAQQVEGVLDWVPETVGYQSFDLGEWWSAATDWEWEMLPRAGRMFWGVWRGERVSGDGILGVIRFKGAPTVQRLAVWVDGQPVDGAMEVRRSERAAGADGTVPSPALGGVHGQNRRHRWFIAALAPGR